QLTHVTHPSQRATPSGAVTHIALDELHLRGKVRGTPARVHTRLQAIQHAHFVVARQQGITSVRADKARPASHQDSTHRPPPNTRHGLAGPPAPFSAGSSGPATARPSGCTRDRVSPTGRSCACGFVR